MFVTVDEAAARLGLSSATVRRRLVSGALAGEKVGRDWRVSEEALGQTGSGSTSTQPRDYSDEELLAAVAHVASTDISEEWVPDVLRWADWMADKPALLARVHAHIDSGLDGHATEVRVPKASFATRAGVLLPLPDRILYQAAIARLAPAIDAVTSPNVFSARLSSDDRYFLARSVSGYVEWRQEYIKRAEEHEALVVVSDLSSYFDTIDQPTLLKGLEEISGDLPTVATVRRQLKSWSVLLHRGIPQGPNASRLLGNAYLLPIDQIMLAEGLDYSRFMDDIAVVVKDQAEAARAIAVLEAACHARGLLVSSAKTKVQTHQEARAALIADDKDQVEYLLSVGSTRGLAELKKVFAKALPSKGGIDVGGVKFALWRLARHLDRSALSRVLERIDDLGPVASVSAAYLRRYLTNARTVSALTAFLEDKERNTSDYFEAWMFAAMLEHPSDLPEAWVNRARIVARDRNNASFHRVLATNVLALGRKANDIAYIKQMLVAEHDPNIHRGCLVALQRVGKLDKATMQTATTRAPELSRTVDYLSGRRALPSLIYRGRTVPVRP